jgi:hypothetical protein
MQTIFLTDNHEIQLVRQRFRSYDDKKRVFASLLNDLETAMTSESLRFRVAFGAGRAGARNASRLLARRERTTSTGIDCKRFASMHSGAYQRIASTRAC